MINSKYSISYNIIYSSFIAIIGNLTVFFVPKNKEEFEFERHPDKITALPSEFTTLISFAAADNDFLNEFANNNNNLNKKYNWQEKTILVVEDDESNFLFMKYALKKTRARVLRATDGREAIEMCEMNPKINLVLMDIQLPILNGYDATVEIKKSRENLPVLAQTAYVSETDKNRCFDCGCNEFIAKPIDKNTLLEIISKYI
ncbi:MAG: response regulator [Bacteroidales bacterium]|nr:response regulator [Bacteroidales bacterium]